MFLKPDPQVSPLVAVAVENRQLHDRWFAAYEACYGEDGVWHMAAVEHELRNWEIWTAFCERQGLPDPGTQIGEMEPVGK